MQHTSAQSEQQRRERRQLRLCGSGGSWQDPGSHGRAGFKRSSPARPGLWRVCSPPSQLNSFSVNLPTLVMSPGRAETRLLPLQGQKSPVQALAWGLLGCTDAQRSLPPCSLPGGCGEPSCQLELSRLCWPRDLLPLCTTDLS